MGHHREQEAAIPGRSLGHHRIGLGTRAAPGTLQEQRGRVPFCSELGRAGGVLRGLSLPLPLQERQRKYLSLSPWDKATLSMVSPPLGAHLLWAMRHQPCRATSSPAIQSGEAPRTPLAPHRPSQEWLCGPEQGPLPPLGQLFSW